MCKRPRGWITKGRANRWTKNLASRDVISDITMVVQVLPIMARCAMGSLFCSCPLCTPGVARTAADGLEQCGREPSRGCALRSQTNDWCCEGNQRAHPKSNRAPGKSRLLQQRFLSFSKRLAPWLWRELTGLILGTCNAVASPGAVRISPCGEENPVALPGHLLITTHLILFDQHVVLPDVMIPVCFTKTCLIFMNFGHYLSGVGDRKRERRIMAGEIVAEIMCGVLPLDVAKNAERSSTMFALPASLISPIHAGKSSGFSVVV
jgi:hypothetical protein